MIFEVEESTMKVSINKLIRHPSHASDEECAIDIYEVSQIGSFIEETMAYYQGQKHRGARGQSLSLELDGDNMHI